MHQLYVQCSIRKLLPGSFVVLSMQDYFYPRRPKKKKYRTNYTTWNKLNISSYASKEDALYLNIVIQDGDYTIYSLS